jgi:hypothetical protein
VRFLWRAIGRGWVRWRYLLCEAAFAVPAFIVLSLAVPVPLLLRRVHMWLVLLILGCVPLRCMWRAFWMPVRNALQ